MIALALALRVRGHVITFCGPSDARPAIELHGLPFVDIGFDARRFLGRHPGFVSGRVRALRTMPAAIRQVIDEQFRALEGAADAADLVITAGAVTAPSSIAEARALLRPRDGVAAAVEAIESTMGQALVTQRAPHAR